MRRGRPTTASLQVRKMSTPSGNCAAFSRQSFQNHSGSPKGAMTAASRMPGPLSVTAGPPSRLRSEEHTSELQSLMRISYAVFCLKKKTQCPHKTQIYEQLTRTD